MLYIVHSRDVVYECIMIHADYKHTYAQSMNIVSCILISCMYVHVYAHTYIYPLHTYKSCINVFTLLKY